MKTFNELRDRTTPEFIKKMCELAEGFECNDNKIKIGVDSCFFENIFEDFNAVVFSTLLHRAVEGWNKEHSDTWNKIIIFESTVEYYGGYGDKSYIIKNYQPCHLTACEMAILDCLLEVVYAAAPPVPTS